MIIIIFFVCRQNSETHVIMYKTNNSISLNIDETKYFLLKFKNAFIKSIHFFFNFYTLMFR